MSKNYFNDEQVKMLSKNKFVLKVSNASITYSDEFKKLFIEEYLDGNLPRIIFEKFGFDIDILGVKRVEAAAGRWKKKYRNDGFVGLKDTRKINSGRPLKRELTSEEKIKKMEAKIKLLEAENELLKKAENDGKGRILKKSEKFEMIQSIINKFDLKKQVSYLCSINNVSKSGYYNYLSSSESRNLQEEKDLEALKVIRKAFKYKGKQKGSRQIKALLQNEFNVCYSLKRIRRIMKKYGLICTIRRANPYKRIAKATKEHSTVKNTLNRDFKQGVPRKVLLTDITYLNYGSGKRAYLSAIKDGSTNEILSYEVSSSLSLDIAINTIQKLCRKHFTLAKEAFIHSDQGFHYTSPKFQKLLKSKRIGQSMSRRGNCWDNAPMESFFGHMKDELELKKCNILSDVKKEIANYMNYYNNHRYQWNLKKMTPVKYRNHLLKLSA